MSLGMDVLILSKDFIRLIPYHTYEMHVCLYN